MPAVDWDTTVAVPPDCVNELTAAGWEGAMPPKKALGRGIVCTEFGVGLGCEEFGSGLDCSEPGVDGWEAGRAWARAVKMPASNAAAASHRLT